MGVFLKGLAEPEYVHVLLNHLPVTGLFAALLSLVGALIVRDRAALFIALVLVTLFSLSAWPVAEYGERGYDRVLAMSDEDGAAYLSRHRDLADRWVFLFYLTAGASVAAMVVGGKWPRFFRAAAMVPAVLGLGSLVAGAVIADCGGKIRHREFRLGPLPVERSGSGAMPPAVLASAGSAAAGPWLSAEAELALNQPEHGAQPYIWTRNSRAVTPAGAGAQAAG